MVSEGHPGEKGLRGRRESRRLEGRRIELTNRANDREESGCMATFQQQQQGRKLDGRVQGRLLRVREARVSNNTQSLGGYNYMSILRRGLPP